MAELNPEVVFNSMTDVVRNCVEGIDKSEFLLSAIGLSTQMHSFIAVDRDGNCLTNVMTYADVRPMEEADFINENFDCHELYFRTGCRAQHPKYPLSKMLWLKNKKSEIFDKTYKFITIKEYIVYKLFGEFLIDITDASATGCFNIHNFTWDEVILKDVLSVSSDMFGHPVECTHVLNMMNKEYADIMGINYITPVVIGSGDGIMANIGCGVFDDTKMSSTIGTSGAIRTAVSSPLLDEKGRTWCYCFTKDTWVAGGAINNGGIILKWLRDNYTREYEHDREACGLESIYDLFNKYSCEIKPGSEGLIFLPYLTGQSSPDWNAEAKGTLHGIQLIHGKKHFIRAAMEGVIYNLFSVYEAIMQINSSARLIVANGGYVNSDIWLQIQADIFNKEIAVAGVGEAAAFGAAFTAMAGIGAISSLKQELPGMRPLKIIKPINENVDIYKTAYLKFKELYTSIYKTS